MIYVWNLVSDIWHRSLTVTHHTLKPVLKKIMIFILLLLLIESSQAQQGIYSQQDLLQGNKKVSIPFRFVHNFILLEVRIFGGIPLNLIFDTGAEHVIIFKREYTDLLQIPYDKRIPIMGSDLSREIYALITRNVLLEIPGLAPKPYDLLVLEEDYFNLEELIGTHVDGIIGGGFFKNLVIQLDYRRNCMTLHNHAQFEIPKDHIVLPIRMKTNKPYVDAEASLQDGSVVTVDLLVDTGAGVPLLLHNNSHPSLKLPEKYIRGRLGMGLGGFLEGYIGRINKLSVGEVEFTGIVTSYQEIQEDWLFDKDRFRHGILGNQLLSRFSVYFDYIHSQLIVKPYHSKQKPFQMDRSGMMIFAYGLEFNKFIVRDIIPNSPAEEADILPNDLILRIQGYPTHFFSLAGINAMLLKKPGKKIRLVISREGKTLKREFYLRDLV